MCVGLMYTLSTISHSCSRKTPKPIEAISVGAQLLFADAGLSKS